MNIRKLFKPYMYFIIFSGIAAGMYICIRDTRPLLLNGIFFLAAAIIITWWEFHATNDFALSFSSPNYLLLLLMFNSSLCVIGVIGCAFMTIYRRYRSTDLPSLYRVIQGTLFNISQVIFSLTVTWKLSQYLHIDYNILTDIWKLILLTAAYLIVNIILVKLIITFQTGKIQFDFKGLGLYLFYSITLTILLIYAYYDRGTFGALLVYIMFIPTQYTTTMYSKLKLQEEELFIDSLTQVYNYKFFTSVLGSKIAKKNPFSLIVIDLDKFKTINDQYGHNTGNKVLQHFSELLRKKTGDRNILCRFGGDEFCIITDGNLKTEELLCNFLNEKSKMYILHNGHTLHYSFSYGITHYDGCDTVSWEYLLDAADKAMYAQKKIKIKAKNPS